MDKIELVIFDMDGLLLDSERCLWIENQKKAAKIYKINYEIEDMRKQMGSGKKESYVFYRKLFGPDFPAEDFRALVEKLNEDFLKDNYPPLRPGAKILLDYLKNKKIKIALGTSSNRQLTESLLKRNNILQYFDTIVCADDVEHGKPFPDIYLKCYESFDIPKENILILEDAHNGLLAGLAAGIKVVLIPDLALLSNQDKEKAYGVFPSLDKLIDIL